MRFTPWFVSAVLVCAFSALGQAVVNPQALDVVHPGTTGWLYSARIGRADTLILGDSVVWHGGNGWDAGFINALKNRTGLYGSGLLGNMGIEGDEYTFAVWDSAGVDRSPDAVRADRRGYVWRQTATTAAPTQASTDFIAYVGSTMLKGSQYDLHLYTVPTGDTGSYQYWERALGSNGFSTPLSPTQQVGLPTKGIQDHPISFQRPAGYNDYVELRVTKAASMSVLYSRVIVPGATGAAVTSWGYGGRSTLDFYRDQWMGGGMTPDGRSAWFQAMTGEADGKLNVVIAEGFNDRNENEISLGGDTVGNSPVAFSNNIKGLIAQVRKEWVASGRKNEDLSFTLLGMYNDKDEQNELDAGVALPPLRKFAIELHNIAAADPQISFVNLQNHVPDYNGLVANGWMYDVTHPTREGALAMSQIIVDALVAPINVLPEPGLGFFVVGAAAVVGRRRR